MNKSADVSAGLYPGFCNRREDRDEPGRYFFDEKSEGDAGTSYELFEEEKVSASFVESRVLLQIPGFWICFGPLARKLAFVFSVLFVCAVGFVKINAAVYFVAQNNIGGCDDSWAGSEAKPWCSITKAAQTIKAGDVVYVKAGVYKEQIFVLAPHGGTENNPITFEAYKNDKVVIDGEGVRTNAFRFGVSYVKVKGFEIQNVTGHGILVGWSDGASESVEVKNNIIHNCGSNPDTAAIYYAGGSHGLIEGNHLYSNAGDGITYSSDDMVIRNNNIHDNEVDGIKGGGGGVQLIENNTIHDMKNGVNHGDGMQLMGMIGTLIVRSNTVWDCTQDIYCDDYAVPAGSRMWGDVYIYNNVVYNTQSGSSGIEGYCNGIVTGARYSSWKSITVCNNTIVDLNNGSGGMGFRCVGDQGSFTVNKAVFCNNILYNSISMIDPSSVVDSIYVDYNIYFNKYRDWYLPGYVGLNVYKQQHPDLEQHSIYTDIQFVNYRYPMPDFRVALNTAQNIDSGIVVPDINGVIFSTDKSNIPRSQGVGWDIGAYEYPAGGYTAPMPPFDLLIR